MIEECENRIESGHDDTVVHTVKSLPELSKNIDRKGSPFLDILESSPRRGSPMIDDEDYHENLDYKDLSSMSLPRPTPTFLNPNVTVTPLNVRQNIDFGKDFEILNKVVDFN